MKTSEWIAFAVFITGLVSSLTWALIWSLATVSRLANELRKKSNDD